MLEQIMHSRKIKYSVLDEKLKPYIAPSKDVVNLFIDIYSLLNPLYNPNTMKMFSSFKVDEKYLISSELLNIAGHYRHYFYSRCNMYSNIYFYYSSEMCKPLTEILPNYRRDFYEKRLAKNPAYDMMNRTVKKNIDIAHTIAEYLPHIYMVNTGEVEPNIVPYHFIKDQDEKAISMVITNDKISFQNVLFGENTIVVDSKGDDSVVVDDDNVIEKSIIGNSTNVPNIIPEFLPYMYALAGYNKYNVDGISKFGMMKSGKTIEKWINDGLLSNMEYEDEEYFASSITGLSVKPKMSDDNLELLKRNFKLLSIKSIYSYLTQKQIINIEDQIVDRVDGKALRFLNDKYYRKYPLRLEYLTEGEEY